MNATVQVLGEPIRLINFEVLLVLYHKVEVPKCNTIIFIIFIFLIIFFGQAQTKTNYMMLIIRKSIRWLKETRHQRLTQSLC